MKTLILDYGMGNCRSIASVVEFLGFSYVIASSPDAIKCASHIIIPGVGSFPSAMQRLDKGRMKDSLLSEIKKGKPVLGICLGLHLLCRWSSELALTKGLDLLPVSVEPFVEGESEKIPHTGFNRVFSIDEKSKLLAGVEEGVDFYFNHSYRVSNLPDKAVALSNNGEVFVAAVEFGNVFATQFHPELSQSNGVQVMRNFLSVNAV